MVLSRRCYKLNHALSVLKLACQVLVFVVFISTVLFFFTIFKNQRLETDKVFLQSMDKAVQEEVLEYNEKTLSGDVIKSLIIQYGDKVAFRVQTKQNMSGFCFFGEMNQSSSDSYIPNKSTFSSVAIKDKNDNFIGMRFTELGSNTANLQILEKKYESLNMYANVPHLFQRELQIKKGLEESRLELLQEQLQTVKAGNRMTPSEMNGIMRDSLAFDGLTSSLASLQTQYLDLIEQQKAVIKELVQLENKLKEVKP